MSRIDVIVPCHNYGRFLRQCVESVLTQSHRDVRVLIIDDASTDDTPRVCAELLSEDARVEVIRHSANIGHIATYNEGIDLARGDYLLELSADDYLLPGALARAAAALDVDPDVGMAPGNYRVHWPDDPPPIDATGEGRVVIYDAWASIRRFARSNFVGTATAVVRTSLQKAVGGYLPELPHAGDLEMWLRFALAGPMAYLTSRQGVYRRHDSNMSEGYDRKADFDQCVAAFRLHLDAIRGIENYGPTLATKVEEIFAGRAAALGISREVPFSFRPIRPPPPVGVILPARTDATFVDAVREALPRAGILAPADGLGWAALAANSPFHYFLALDGTVHPTPGQIVALARRLEAEPQRAHGLCGARLEAVDGSFGVREPMVRLDGPVSVLSGVLAFSGKQAAAARRLHGRLSSSVQADSRSNDEVLISCAAAKAPICHDLGPVAGAAGVDARARGVRLGAPGELMERLLGMQAIRTFKPMSARRGPWGPPRRPRPHQP